MRHRTRGSTLVALGDFAGSLIQDAIASVEAGSTLTGEGTPPLDLLAQAILVEEFRISIPARLSFGRAGGGRPFRRRPWLTTASGSMRKHSGRVSFSIGIVHSLEVIPGQDEQAAKSNHLGAS